MSYQKTVLVGHLGGPVDYRFTPQGKPVSTFTVYVNDGWGDRKKTIKYRVTAWERTAEICNEFLSKGSKVLVEGRLQADQETYNPRVFQRQDGTHGASYELTADRVVFMGDRDPNDNRDQQESYNDDEYF